MAYNGTLPSMAELTLAAQMGSIRENFRAVTQGDLGVFTKAADFDFQVSTTGTTTFARLFLAAGNGTTSGRLAYVFLRSAETSQQDWLSGMFGTKEFVIRNVTAVRNDLTIDTSGNFGVGGASQGQKFHIVSADGAGVALGTSLAGIRIVNQTAAVGGEKAEIGFAQLTTKPYAAITGWLMDGANNTRGDIVFSNRHVNTDANLTERMRIDTAGNVSIGVNSSLNVSLGVGNVTTSAAAVSYRLLAGSSKYGWAIGAQNSVHDTLEFMPTTAAGGLTLASPIMVLSQAGQVRIGTTAPGARLHVGIGSTGTNSEEVRVDSGSGSGAHPLLGLYRNGTLKAYYGVAGGSSDIIAGAAADDLCLRNVQRMLFSVDGGASVSAVLDAGRLAIGGQAPPSGVKLLVGVGGTGTTAEEIRVDSGSGSGGYAICSFYRNSAVKGIVGVAGASSNIIAGLAANEMGIRSAGLIGFSTDNGTTMHATLDTNGNLRAKNHTATAAAIASAAGEISYGSTTATTVGAAGGASALPATPTGYIIVNIAGTNFKIPYYAN